MATNGLSLKAVMDEMNAIQRSILSRGDSTADERSRWSELRAEVLCRGYVLSKRRTRDLIGRVVKVVWSAVPKEERRKSRERRFVAEWRKVRMEPEDGGKHCGGDCTTRSMSYCLREVFTYREIEREQYRLAEKRNEREGRWRGDGRRKYHRNSMGVWDEVMTGIGYRWISLSRKVRRDVLAKVLDSIERPVITLSSGHVAVVERGVVVDSWDSRGGRCTKVLVSPEDADAVVEVLSRSRLAA